MAIDVWLNGVSCGKLNILPAFDPKDLLKLCIYGYLNSMRSSRILEKECNRNYRSNVITKGVAPNHNTNRKQLVNHQPNNSFHPFGLSITLKMMYESLLIQISWKIIIYYFQ